VEFLRRWIGWAGLALLAAGLFLAWSLPLYPLAGTALLAAAAAVLAAHLVWNWTRVRLFSRGRGSRYSINALLYTLAVAGILVVVNVLVARHDLRWDATAERFHSLSPQARRILATMEETAEALAFLPAGHPGRSRAQDILALMKAASRGRLTYEIVDPVTEPDRAVEHEVFRPATVFLAGDGSARTYDISESAYVNTLLEAAQGDLPVVCLSTGHGERDGGSSEQNGYLGVADALRRERYAVTDVHVLKTDDLPARCTVLVIPGPRKPFLEGEAERVARYLEAGGAVLAMVEPEIESWLEALLEKHGALLSGDQVVELAMAKGFGPLNPVSNTFDPDHPVTEPLARSRVATVFSNARSVEVHDEVKYRPELDVVCLAKTSARGSYAESTPGVISFREGEDREGPICLGVASSRDLSLLPSIAGEEPPPTDAPVQRMVVWGDADFATNFYLSLGANTDLFLNLVGWLARRGELLDLRSPERAPRTIVLHDTQARLIFAVCIIGLPLVLLCGGAAVWFRRRRM